MKYRRYFYRNAQARDHLEIFLVSAVSSLLLLRFYLSLTGYPQVGGGSLHIAHMLYGGLLMMTAIAVSLTFLGVRAERLASTIGGVGFGIFIDELGKFITKDNNYFFRPTIGIIYAIFCVLYLAFNFITRNQRLTSEEYQLNALRQFEETISRDMDQTEKETMRRYLQSADPKSPITKSLELLLEQASTVKTETNWVTKLRRAISRSYMQFWRSRSSSRLVTFIFMVQAFAFIAVVANAVLHNFNSIQDLLDVQNNYVRKLIIAQLFASLVTAGFVVVGAVRLPVSRIEALEWFRRAVLTNLFLTEFFIFCRIEFRAIPGFLLNLFLLGLLRFALYQEDVAGRRHTKHSS